MALQEIVIFFLLIELNELFLKRRVVDAATIVNMRSYIMRPGKNSNDGNRCG